MSEIVIDAADPTTLATWWSELLGWPVVYTDDDGEEVELGPPDGHGATLLFVRVADAKTTKNRLHLDLRPQDGSSQQAELERLVAHGARRADVGQGPDVTWVVLADPEDNEFCLLRGTPADVAAYAEEQGGPSPS